MKNFIKAVNWKEFWKYELFVMIFLIISYFLGNNKFPHNFIYIFIAGIGWAIIMLVENYMNYRHNSRFKID